jgi:CBS-domain-containing membrane protein
MLNKLEKYRKLPFRNLSEHCGLASPKLKTDGLALNSAATLLMTDFTKTSATTASDSISVNDALELMRANRIRALMLIGHNGEFSGVIRAMDLMGRKPMQYASEAGIRRTDVLVKNIMLPKYKMKAVNRNDIEHATIGEVMKTFLALGEQHLLVVEGIDEHMMISGMFSVSDFKRNLEINIDPPLVAYTFSDIERVINEHKEVM